MDSGGWEEKGRKGTKNRGCVVSREGCAGLVLFGPTYPAGTMNSQLGGLPTYLLGRDIRPAGR